MQRSSFSISSSWLSRTPIRWMAFAVAAMAVGSVAQRAVAQNVFTGGGGANNDWSNGNNWSFGTPPSFSDTTYLNNGGTLKITTSGNQVGIFAVGTAADTGVDAANQGLGGTVNFNGGSLTSGSAIPSIDVGVVNATPGASVWNMNTGTLTVGNLIRMGVNGGSAGTFNMNGGIVNVGSGNNANLFIVGDNGNGTFTMNGGAINTLGQFGVAFQAGSNSSFTLNSGTITDGNEFYLGRAGKATATMTGGTIAAHFDVFVGQFASSAGTSLTMSGGAITSDFNFIVAGGSDVPNKLGANSTVTLSGGSVNVKGNIRMSDSAYSRATVNQSGGSVSGNEILIGAFGDADYTLSGNGTIDANSQINLATFQPGERPDTAADAPKTRFTQSGTSVVTTPGLIVAEFGNAAYTLNGGTVTVLGAARNGATLPAGNDPSFANLIVGRAGAGINAGTGLFTQNGGTVNVATNVFLGDFDAGRGSFVHNGGVLNVTRNFSVGGALASNAPVAPTGTQGQSVDADGVFTVHGSAGSIHIGGNLLANAGDNTRTGGGGEHNNSTLVFDFLDLTGTTLIDVDGLADLTGAVIDINELNGFAMSASQTFKLLNATSVSNDFTLAAADLGRYSVFVGADAQLGGQTLYAKLAVAPEPASLAAVGLAGLLLGRRRRTA